MNWQISRASTARDPRVTIDMTCQRAGPASRFGARMGDVLPFFCADREVEMVG